MPHYNFEDFKSACEKGRNYVVVNANVLRDADQGFNLKTESAILEFIANGGIESREFVNSKVWAKNPDKKNPIMVDAYEFRSMSRRGYIAFFQSNKTQKWVLKSLKPSHKRNRSMEFALRRAGLIECKERSNS